VRYNLKFFKNFRKYGKANLEFFIFLAVFFVAVISVYSYSVLGEFSSSSLSALQTGTDCGRLLGNYSGCAADSACMWKNNSGTILEDPWCTINFTNYNSSDSCIFGGPSVGIPCRNLTGGSILNAGCCLYKMGGGGGGGGMMGCPQFDGNYSGCANSSVYGITGCSWKANNINQNPWCMINSLNNARSKNPSATTVDIGCCEMQGCWSFRGNQTIVNATYGYNCTSALGGVCSYSTACPEPGGCCAPKACNEVSTQDKCNQLIQLGNPCTWSGSCQMVGGGFFQYNTTDSCFSQAGWWNGSTCIMPGASGGGGMGGGGGGFMFAQEARCWFADNKPGICNNVTGCIYCNDTTTQINNDSSICYNKRAGACQGHEPAYTNWNGTASVSITDTGLSILSMNCTHIRLKQICNCGPLPNCVWANTTSDSGSFCQPGLKSTDNMQSCQPPAPFCEHSLAKNNETLCLQLAETYMMPCKWENTTTPALNCTFNSNAVFGTGTGGGNLDYNLISGETSCVAAGGTWRSEYYVDNDGTFKQDSWCEKGAMFDFASRMAVGNKGNCDTDCWACEFNSTGGSWGTGANGIGNATFACVGSKKGVCVWKNDTNAPNDLGYCDYPKEFSFGGGKDCATDCKACELMFNATRECWSSPTGCAWFNDTLAPKGGYCMGSSRKSCYNDCFSCYEQSSCANITYHPSINCSWDAATKFCKPLSFTGEICFNAVDDDNDGATDCADSDCSFDMFCGGGSMGSGGTDCKRIFLQTPCIKNISSSGKNCTWVTPTFGGSPYCDFPGSNCWMYENNVNGCTGSWRNDTGCMWRNATNGFFGFCDINKTNTNVCFNSTNAVNLTLCNAVTECQWISDLYMGSGGRCEFKLFAMCGGNATNMMSSASCYAAGGGNKCAWRNDSFSPNRGFCEPICFSRDAGSCTSGGLGGLCSVKSSSCEPEMFVGGGGTGGGGGGMGFGCHMYDMNYTGCMRNNMTCMWKTFSQNASQGVCNEKGQEMMIQGMDMSAPKPLGQDPADTTPNETDIRQFGVKDLPASLSFGIVVTNITNAAVCKGYMVGGMGGGPGNIPVSGAGTATTKFYWYLDTNKNTTDNCNATIQGGNNPINDKCYKLSASMRNNISIWRNTASNNGKRFIVTEGANARVSDYLIVNGNDETRIFLVVSIGAGTSANDYSRLRDVITGTDYDFATGTRNATLTARTIGGAEYNAASDPSNPDASKWTVNLTWGTGSNFSRPGAVTDSVCAIDTGYEFLVKYVVSLSNASNPNSASLETKSFYRCSRGEWVLTNVPLTSNRNMMCGMNMDIPGGKVLGGVMIVIDKQNLESFSNYNKTAPMRVFISSANATYSELAPLDSVNSAGYYTPGSADFKFVDCMNPNTKDEKCKNFQKFGFNVFEDCKNGIDDDGDGMTDCVDPKCKFTPVCASGTAFSFVADENDKQAPTVSFSNVDVLHNSASVKFDTDEPANGTLKFYGNDSTCNSLNASINELGDPALAFDDFKPFHLVPLDDVSLGYSLINGTTYFYKTLICDPSSNCAESACLNFTTKTDSAYKNFIFKMKLPPGYNVTIPALSYSGNFTANAGGRAYDVGIKTNASVSRNMNVTINCGTQSMTFIGVDIMKPKSIDLTNAFVCNQTGNVLGMNSSSKSWNQAVSDLNLGGSGDYIKLTFPVTYSSSNNISWCNDDGSTNCSVVNNYAACASGGTSKTDCKIPTSLGFSAYKISTVSSPGGGTTPSGGGGGGGGATGSTYSINEDQFILGYSKELAKDDKIKFPIGGVTHILLVTKLTSSTISLNISSITIQTTLGAGEEKKFDLTGDNYYDLLVSFAGYNSSSSKGKITIKSLHELTSTTTTTETTPSTGTTPTTTTTTTTTTETTPSSEKSKINLGKYWWVVIVLVVIIVIIVLIVFGRRGVGKDKGVMMIDGSFLNSLKEKVQGKNYSGKWIKV